MAGSLRRAAGWAKRFLGGDGRDDGERHNQGRNTNPPVDARGRRLSVVSLHDNVLTQCEIESEVEKAYTEGKKLWTKEMLEKLENDLDQEGEFFIEPYVDEYNPLRVQFQYVNPITASVIFDFLLTISSFYISLSNSIKFLGYHDLAHSPMMHDPVQPNVYSIQIYKSGNPSLTPRIPHPGPSHRDRKMVQTLDHLWAETSQIRVAMNMRYHLRIAVVRAQIPAYVDKIVCFNLGHLGAGHETWRCGILRHLAAVTMASMLSEKYGTYVQIYCQDVSYTPACITVLENKGIKVVGMRGALGFTIVDDKTLVFAPSSESRAPVKEIIADLVKPAAMLWLRVKSEDQAATSETPRTRELVEWYNKYTHTSTVTELLGDVVTYVKRSDGDQTSNAGMEDPLLELRQPSGMQGLVPKVNLPSGMEHRIDIF
ncbi:hypothetical protein HD806DRAFT_551319 [Xylariaceae sp. AK1471]|nr:hypothetical protein HD806DRAFT_551319 [Xylariaceae sp. AK1471]